MRAQGVPLPEEFDEQNPSVPNHHHHGNDSQPVKNRMATSSQRPTSSTNASLRPFRRNTQHAEPAAYRTTLLNPKPLTANSKETSGTDRARRASTPSPRAAEGTGKEREAGNGLASVDSSLDTDPDYNPSTSSLSYDSNILHIPPPRSSARSQSRPSTAGTSGAPSSHPPASLLKRTRGSILVAASDALGNFKLGRRRTKTSPPQSFPTRPQAYVPAVILPGVIEISAPRRDEEMEEREKLKEAAARAILGPAFLDNGGNNGHLRESSTSLDVDEDESRNNHDDVSVPDEVQSISNMCHGNVLNSSTVSVARPRYPARSMHSRNNSFSPVPLPSFPSTPSALSQCKQDSATFPKYYPSTSLRIFAMSKSWKSRYMILSSPITFPMSSVTLGKSPARSYLHLFKSSGSDEKELERLEINEDSVVFVADEEVAGRRHVVKVGGVDVGALKRELNCEEDGRVMWFLQITDPIEAQKWIANIKSAILSQRTLRAGLSAAQTPTNEPRGDLDVIMKIRHASINTDTFRPSITSLDKVQSPLTSPTYATSPTPYSPANSPTPITPPTTATSFAQSSDPDSPRKGHYEDSLKRAYSSKHVSPNYAASVSSQSIRSQATSPKSGHVSISSNAVTTLKGLFNRPRSGSRASHATSFDQDRDGGFSDKSSRVFVVDDRDREAQDGSFASMGNSLLGMLRSPDGRSVRLNPSSSGSSTPQRNHTMLPFAGGPMITSSGSTSSYDPAKQLERKIATHSELQSAVQDHPTSATGKDRAGKTLSLGALSLQPPPRKRWTVTSGGFSPTETKADHSGLYHHVNGNSSVAGSFGLNAFSSQHDRASTHPLTDSSPTVSGHSFGTPEERPRAPSLQSVSTFASTGDAVLERSSTSTKRSNSMKRWSRQGSNMLSVPSQPSMPHAPSHGSASSSAPSFVTPNGRVHPYAAGGSSSNVDRPPSRTSIHSAASDQSVVSGLPTFSKRASTSSAISVNLNGGPQMHAYSNGFTNTISRITNTHRATMPPPPRPAPTSALPPAPDQEVFKPASPQKTSFRENMAQRALKLSRMAPSPPPPTALPPRPDEIVAASTSSHRRTSSMGSGRQSSEMYIPSSPLSISAAPPYPPPSGPLPPTPSGSTSPPTRAISIKRRLRILSAPSQAGPGDANGSTPSLNLIPTSLPNVSASIISNSQPATPIAEKIIDTSFLTMYTPITPSLPPPIVRTTSPPPDQLSEVTSLSPPPRRSSKQMSLFDKEIDGAIAPVDEESLQVDIDPKPLSISRHGSVISLGIVSM